MNNIDETKTKLDIAEKAGILTMAEQADHAETIEILVNAGVIEPKPWWKSISIGGTMAALGGSLAMMVTSLAKSMGYEIDIGATELLIGSIVGVVSALATWWGRVHSVQPISTKVLP